MHTQTSYARDFLLTPCPFPFPQDLEELAAHLTCSFLTVGHVNATFTKDSRVDMEKLFLLRLHNGGKVSGVDALDPVGREK